MKRAALFLAWVAGFSACATSRYVAGPDGYPAIYVRCPSSRQDKCAQKAERACPYGYEMIEPPAYGRMLIRCS